MRSLTLCNFMCCFYSSQLYQKVTGYSEFTGAYLHHSLFRNSTYFREVKSSYLRVHLKIGFLFCYEIMRVMFPVASHLRGHLNLKKIEASIVPVGQMSGQCMGDREGRKEGDFLF